MICPNCKKQETAELKTHKKQKDVLRERYCAGCDFSFITIEKIKSFKKRKARPYKLLMNYRFFIYGCKRLLELRKTFLNLIDDVNAKSNEWGFFNRSGKSGIYVKNKKGIHVLTSENKKLTIEKILSEPAYWRYKNLVLKKQILNDDEIKIIKNRLKNHRLKEWLITCTKERNEVEKKLAIIVFNEIETFHKSVSTYIDREEYNREFFKNYLFSLEDVDLKDVAESMKEEWEDDSSWEFYLQAR